MAREGAVPLAPPVSGMAAAETLHIAVVIPPFRRGSGGHSTIYNLLSRLEEQGHTVSTWLFDPSNRHASDWPAVLRADLREYFRPINGPVFKGFDDWYGADVVIATGWDTVYAVQRLPDCPRPRISGAGPRARVLRHLGRVRVRRAHLQPGPVHIAASPYLRDLVTRRYGGEGISFVLGVDHDVYRPRDIARRRDTVIFYARDATPRRAVPLGVLALEELHRRRPDVRFVLFGDEHRVPTHVRASTTSASHRPSSSRGRTRRRPSGCRCR